MTADGVSSSSTVRSCMASHRRSSMRFATLPWPNKAFLRLALLTLAACRTRPADCAVALIFMIARERRVQAGLGRQVRSRRGDRLDTGLFVIGNDRH